MNTSTVSKTPESGQNRCYETSKNRSSLNNTEIIHITSPVDNFDFIECLTTTFLRAHSWLNWVDPVHNDRSRTTTLDHNDISRTTPLDHNDRSRITSPNNATHSETHSDQQSDLASLNGKSLTRSFLDVDRRATYLHSN